MTVPGPTPAATGSDSAGELLLTDFTATGRDLGWFIVNDNVMGGRSEGDFEQNQGELRFAGRTNTNGGGFSSIRTKPVQLDLSKHTGIRLHVQGDGRRYTWRLSTDARWRGRQISYWADFETHRGKWSTADIPFSSFVPRFRGSELDGPALDPAEITGMGLMIYDDRDGPFELRLDTVKAYAAEPPFSLASYRWKKRVLLVSAATEYDEHLAKQLSGHTRSPGDFTDRDLVLVTLLDDAVSAAEGRPLAASDVETLRHAVGIQPGSFALRLIGKDGSIKMSRDAAVPMTEIYALIDSMPMRQSEKRDQENRTE